MLCVFAIAENAGAMVKTRVLSISPGLLKRDEDVAKAMSEGVAITKVLATYFLKEIREREMSP